MAAPVLSAADYLAAFQSLLPRGRVWPREADAIQTQTFAALMKTYERQHLRSNALLVDAFPSTTEELLPEWEKTLGLPDPCAGESPTIQQRRAQVVARFAGRGGQSPSYFIGYAANLGYTITIKQYAPARVGASSIGDPLNGQDWAHAWSIVSAEFTVTYAAANQSAVGEPLAAWGNAVLECELKAIAPAHTVQIFEYISGSSFSPDFSADFGDEA